jgi:putative CocE/NonD family hydrolase
MRSLVLGLAVLAFAAAPAHAVTSKCNEPIPVSDGAVLRGNVVLPEDGKKFATIVTVTGYNKDATNPTGTSCESGGALASVDQDLLKAGYAILLVDDRGTGASQGSWDSWGERTQQDYGELLDWIQAQPWSNGDVGMTGASYMGITSLLVTEADAVRVAAGKPRAVKAVWADVPMSDAYRDVTYHGGSIDAGFIPLWLGLTTTLSNIPPSTTVGDPVGSAPTYAQHVANTFDFAGRMILDSAVGGDGAYDGPFYRLRSPGDRAASIKVPVAWVGGWWDIFQRGEPRLFEQLTNVPEKLFFMNPQYHIGGDATAWPMLKIGTPEEVKIRWFDRWLKGVRNGVEDLPDVNLWTQGSREWEHLDSWPPRNARYTPYHLQPGGGLAREVPKDAGGDETPLLPFSSPCSRLTAQWTAGAASAVAPCETDNRTFEATALTWTTPVLEKDTKVTGLVTADLWAELRGAKDATLVAVLSDVAPGGESTQLTAGFLLASQRAIDRKQSTKDHGRIIRPFHPFTRAAQQDVPPNDPQRYRIEIYPTSNVFKAGHRMRLTLATANTPSTLTTIPSTVNQLGGTLRVLRGRRYPSHLLLPVSGDFPSIDLPSARRCVSRRDFVIHLRGDRLRRATVWVHGKRVKVVRRHGRLIARVDLRGLPKGRYVIRIRAVTAKGHVVHARRAYRTCAKKP